MAFRVNFFLPVVSLLFLIIIIGTAYFICQKIFSMPFRATNDALHQHGALITLDSLIPAGTHIDEKMTIGQVARIRFKKPKGRFDLYMKRISESIPLKYRLFGTMVLYFFWTFLFLVFFRIFTWIRYAAALIISLLAGALVYFFMPDLIVGRSDDVVFLSLAIASAVAGWWYSRGREV